MEEKRRVKIATNLLVLVIAIFIFLVLFEIIVRIFFPVSDVLYIGDNNLGYKHIPNDKGQFVILEHTTKFQINNEGFNDINHNITNSNGKYRIEMLGDSYVDALTVDKKDSFDSLVQEKLNELYPKKYDIFNFGVNSYSTAQEYLTYRYYGEKYKPNEVYLFWFINDPSDTCGADPNKPTYYLENNEVKMRPFIPKNYSKFELFVSKYYKTAVFLRNEYYQFKSEALKKNDLSENNIRELDKVFLKNYDNQTNDCWNLSMYFIKKLDEETKKDGVKLTVLGVPHPAVIYDEYRQRLIKTETNLEEKDFDFIKPYNLLKDFSKKENITYVDLIEPLKSKSDEDLFYYYDWHLNKNGHGAVSDIILNGIVKNR